LDDTTGYRLEIARSHAVLRLDPHIGNAAWGDIDRVGNQVITRVNDKFANAWLIDLSGLDYMGSALVALVVRVWKAVQGAGGRAVVVCGDGMPQEVLRLAGLDKVWTITRTYEEGLAKLGVSPAQPESQDGFPVLSVLALVLAAVAATVLTLLLRGIRIPRDLAVAGTYGGAGMAVALAAVGCARGRGWGRVLAALVLLAGIAVIVVGVLKIPSP
jgi:anti-anti-sigma factor